MPGKQRIRVGLDIGNDAVKIVEMIRSDGKMLLGAAAVKKIRRAGREGVVDSIRELAAENGVTAKDANISVSGPSVIVRFIVMPRMTESDLKNAIRFEAEKHIPFDIGECVIGHHLIKRGRKDGKQDVILVAAKKDMVAERVKMAESAGFSVGVVDVDEFAVTNSFMSNFPDFGPDKTAALLNIGSKITNVSILCGSSILLARDIGIGGRDFDAAVSKALNLAPSDAEKLRIAPGDRLPEIVACTKSICGSLCDDIKLSFGYYENQCGKGVEEVYLSGGGSAFEGIAGQLQETLGLKAAAWDPLRFLDKSSSRTDAGKIEMIRGHLAVASGLALR